MTLATILYEDQLGAEPNNYGPHMFLLACVADETGADRWELRGIITANPRKGCSKLRATLQQDARLLDQRGPVYVLFDEDRVRECYQLPEDTCRPEVLTTIRGDACAPVRVVLLERNMEDVVAACCKALPRSPPTGKPTPSERDRILNAAASEVAAVARRQVRAAVPSLDRIVLALAEWVRGGRKDQRPPS